LVAGAGFEPATFGL